MSAVPMTSVGPNVGPAAAKPLRRGLITVSIMLATIMQALDTTIANVALPHMQGSLQSSQDQISWVLTSYIVAAAIATPLTGWLCGRWGRRQVFLTAVAGFTVASALCGMADTLWQIVLARLLQGVFGAALVPLSQAVLMDINPKEKLGQAMAIWGAGIMVGPILGPVLGGWLTENASWRWVFFINLPVGVLAFYGIARFLPESKPTGEKLDMFGFVTLSLAIGLFQMFLDRGEQADWFSATEIRVEAIGAAVAFLFFAAHTATVRGPSFFDRGLLRDRNLMSGLFFIFIIGMVLYSTMALLPTLLQGLLSYPVVFTGEVMAPRGVGTMVSMLLVGRLVQYIDGRKLVLVGLSLTALSLWQMTRITPDMDSTLLIVSGLLQGFGLGFAFVPMGTIAFATIPASLRNSAASMYSLFRNIGSSVGISLVQALLIKGSAQAHAELSVHISRNNLAVPALPPAFSVDTATGLAFVNAEVNRQAAMIGYINDFRLMLILTLLAMPLLLLIRKAAPAANGAPTEVPH